MQTPNCHAHRLYNFVFSVGVLVEGYPLARQSQHIIISVIIIIIIIMSSSSSSSIVLLLLLLLLLLLFES